MDHIRKKIDVLRNEFNLVYDQLAIDDEKSNLDKLEKELARPEIWNNPTKAAALNKTFSSQQSLVQPWLTLKMQLSDIDELIDISDDDMAPKLEGQIEAMTNQLNDLKKALLFKGEYDNHDAIIRITAGVGGTDAQDFAEMLERMYLRWAEKSDMNTNIISRSAGDEAGLKTSVIEISSGVHIYGKLRSEHGVHRLVRLSPFNSDNLRQTSFVLVEVLPQIDQPEDLSINDKDLKIDVYRAGGHGGQGVNTTDSAVRVTHIPTGIVVSIQNERSQLQNKETALKILRSKLAQLKEEQRAQRISDLQAGESASWGAQIRNYVLHPYTLVKDARTKYEDKDVKSVLDGKIDGFSQSFLESKL